MEGLEDHPSIITIDVQWGDMDALGHVNNTVPVRWYESSRINYMEVTGIAELMEGLGFGPILAAVHCNYRRQLFYPDTVRIGCRATRLGGSSVTLSHTVVSEKSSEVSSDGESILVIFDFKKQKPVRIPDGIRQRVIELHPELA